jgi:1,4-alpha-glucan branching enzyme
MQQDIQLLIESSHPDSFAFLGAHLDGYGGYVVRAFDPYASSFAVLVTGPDGEDVSLPGEQIHAGGIFQAPLTGFYAPPTPTAYRLEFTYPDGAKFVTYDPYSFPPFLGELDRYLFAEGNHHDLYTRLGAHLTTVNGVAGVAFAVWAPNAKRVSVVGDFNRWDGRTHTMRKHPAPGLWDIFIPGLTEGVLYKFEIKDQWGNYFLKSDPMAFFSQNGLETASIVYDLGKYQWNDEEWMQSRADRDAQRQPLSIYEVHLGSWARVPEEGNRTLTYLEMADRLIPYVKEMGFTHIELMPIAEHPFDGSWGYQVVSFYAPTSRFGSPDEFRLFVDRCHQAGLGVILDWVPAHFPKDAHGLARFDGTALYEHMDPREGEHRDWGTLIFNFGRNEVRNFLIANALFWLGEYHIDGLRVDAVASMLYRDYSRKAGDWIPNIYGGRENLEAIYFMKRFNELAYERYPGIMTIAEESTAWPGVSRPTYLGGLGFGFKWNMGWMNDSLRYIEKQPIHRRFHQNDITFSLLYAFHENFILVLSHDEVVHGKQNMILKMPGDWWQKFANLRMFLAWMYAHPGKKLLFQGIEFGQSKEWQYNESLQWHLLDYAEHAGMKRLVRDLNHVYKSEPAFYTLDDSFEGFEWIDFHDADSSVVSFIRKGSDGSQILVIVNATPVVRPGYRIGLPGPGYYREILNTDAGLYAGSNVGNAYGLTAERTPYQGRGYSAAVTLPPLATLMFRYEG